MEKKSERLELRLAQSEKSALLNASEAAGETPSETVRHLIQEFVRDTDQRAISSGLGAALRSIKRNAVPVSIWMVAVLGVAGIVYAYQELPNWTYSPPQTEEGLFSKYDADQNGLLLPGEIADNDISLHWVLDLDGCMGISLNEFYEKGTMTWGWVPRSFSREMLGKTPGAFNLGETGRNTVSFDLTDPENPQIRGLTGVLPRFQYRRTSFDNRAVSQSQSESATADRSVLYVNNSNTSFVLENWEYRTRPRDQTADCYRSEVRLPDTFPTYPATQDAVR